MSTFRLPLTATEEAEAKRETARKEVLDTLIPEVAQRFLDAGLLYSGNSIPPDPAPVASLMLLYGFSEDEAKGFREFRKNFKRTGSILG